MSGNKRPLIRRIGRVWRERGLRGVSESLLARLDRQRDYWRDRIVPDRLPMTAFLDLCTAPLDLLDDLDAFAISPWLSPAWVQSRPEAVKADIVARAEPVMAHTMDLLGSGPVRLGSPLPWRRDFRSGREWPTVHWRDVRLVYDDDSDIKRPWELSRFQHLPLLAQAWWVTADAHYAHEFAAQVDHWLRDNPTGYGPNWVVPMEAAIRSINWLHAAVGFRKAGLEDPFWIQVCHSLFEHGRFIRRHLEWTPTRGNHYLSNLVGLLFLGTFFRRIPEGAAWQQFARVELETEIGLQVDADGMAQEAALSYHRLVAELFLTAEQLVMKTGQPLSEAYHDRVALMLTATQRVQRSDGLMPQIGDADDGRIQQLADYGRWRPGDACHLWTDWGSPWPGSSPDSAAFATAGIYVLRHDRDQITLHGGPTGMGGVGPHGHNDQLAFEWCRDGQPVILDPGTWTYTGDPAGRDRFRSTAYHATVRIDGEEQNPIPDDLFRLPDVTQTRCLDWDDGPDAITYTGRHHGYQRLASPVTVTRSLRLDKIDGSIRLTEHLEGQGDHVVEWFFPVPGCPHVLDEAGWPTLLIGDLGELTIRPQITAGFQASLLAGDYSPAYGVCEPAQRLHLRWQGRLPLNVVIEISLAPARER
jgi:hypothetical protein